MEKQARRSECTALRLVCNFAVFCALLGGRCASAQVTSKPFSADMTKTTGNKTTTAKVHVIATAMRSEGVEAGKKYISIMRYDRNVMWSLMPDEKIYVEMPIPAGAEVAAGMKEMTKGAQVKHESLGSEQVGGYQCDKSRTTVTWQGITTSTVQWAAKELGEFVVKKLDEKLGQITEFKNIQLGPQDPSLFEPHAGYRKMSMGGFQKP